LLFQFRSVVGETENFAHGCLLAVSVIKRRNFGGGKKRYLKGVTKHS
jgi:hypothetical protein